MWFDLGKWVHKKDGEIATSLGERYSIGFRQYKVSFKMTKKNQELVRAMLMGDSPQFYSRLIDLVVDVWGMAGPDCCTQPV